jgi:hypothetical protein
MANVLGSTLISGSATFGCTAETGILITSFSATSDADKVEIRDNDGDVALKAYYNQKTTFSVGGVITGTTGIAAASVASILTVANLDSLVGGVSGGGNYVESVAISKKPDGFKEITVSGVRNPNIS